MSKSKKRKNITILIRKTQTVIYIQSMYIMYFSKQQTVAASTPAKLGIWWFCRVCQDCKYLKSELIFEVNRLFGGTYRIKRIQQSQNLRNMK